MAGMPDTSHGLLPFLLYQVTPSLNIRKGLRGSFAFIIDVTKHLVEVGIERGGPFDAIPRPLQWIKQQLVLRLLSAPFIPLGIANKDGLGAGSMLTEHECGGRLA